MHTFVFSLKIFQNKPKNIPDSDQGSPAKINNAPKPEIPSFEGMYDRAYHEIFLSSFHVKLIPKGFF